MRKTFNVLYFVEGEVKNGERGKSVEAFDVGNEIVVDV